MATKKTTPPKKTAAPKTTAASGKAAANETVEEKAPAQSAPAAQQSAREAPDNAPPEAPAVDAIPFDLRVLDGLDERIVTAAIQPPTYFAAAISAASPRRFLHLLQKDAENGQIVLMLLADTEALGGALRLPGAGAWIRAIVHGTVHLLGADVPLLREEIVAYLGGHEPAPQLAKPPYT